jgi:hypothetical protein
MAPMLEQPALRQDAPWGLRSPAYTSRRFKSGAGFAECYTAPETYWLDIR